MGLDQHNGCRFSGGGQFVSILRPPMAKKKKNVGNIKTHENRLVVCNKPFAIFLL